MSGPYGISALTYYEAGFSPLPAIGKLLQVSHVSGRHPDATRSQIEKWSISYGPLNVALRLPTNVIALDVDEYKGDLNKLSELEAKLGKLPRTWNADSRGGSGGKLLYRVPPGIKWRSNINGITVVQRTHRYVMVFPSYNKASDSRYLWYDGLSGLLVPDDAIPEVNDLAELPTDWVKELTKEENIQVWSHSMGISTDELDIFNDEAPCQYMKIITEFCKEKIIDGYTNGLHDSGLSAIGVLVTAATNGHSGIQESIEELAKVFFAGGRNRNLALEWDNLLSFVLAQVDMADISEVDICKLKMVTETNMRNDIALLLSSGFTSGQIARFLGGRRR